MKTLADVMMTTVTVLITMITIACGVMVVVAVITS
jgi:hypothetical protein